MYFQVIFCFYLVGACYARTETEIRAWFFRQGVECSKEHPVTVEELKLMHEHKLPETRNAKCLNACVLRRVDWLDSKGMFDIEKGIAYSENEYADNPTKLEGAKKLFEFCKKDNSITHDFEDSLERNFTVNDETVTDGEEGCDRAHMLAKCLIENAKEYGFELIPTSMPEE